MITPKSLRKKVSKLERRVAVELGGRKTFASGSGDEKGDGRVPQRFTQTAAGPRTVVRTPMRIENKLTSKPHYTLSHHDWFKLYDAAVRSGESPVFHIRMTLPGVGQVEVVVLSGSWACELGILAHLPLPTTAKPAASKQLRPMFSSDPPLVFYMRSPFLPERIHGLVICAYSTFKKKLEQA